MKQNPKHCYEQGNVGKGKSHTSDPPAVGKTWVAKLNRKVMYM